MHVEFIRTQETIRIDDFFHVLEERREIGRECPRLDDGLRDRFPEPVMRTAIADLGSHFLMPHLHSDGLLILGVITAKSPDKDRVPVRQQVYHRRKEGKAFIWKFSPKFCIEGMAHSLPVLDVTDGDLVARRAANGAGDDRNEPIKVMVGKFEIELPVFRQWLVKIDLV